MLKRSVKHIKNAVIINGVIHELVKCDSTRTCTDQCSLKSICAPYDAFCMAIFGKKGEDKMFAEVKTKNVMSN